MFAAPPELSLEWSDAGVEGAHRFLKRLWKQVYSHRQQSVSALDVSTLNAEAKVLRRQVHETIKKVGHDLGQRYTFNTAIAACMELLNALSKAEGNANLAAVVQEGLEAVVLMLSPIVPHITQVLWEALGHEGLIIDVAFPRVDESALVRDSVMVVVQVNGKLRANIEVAIDSGNDAVQAAALADENVQKFTEGKSIKKVVVVPNKLVNIVVA
jgi:leucyl-tRNA synthetase